jgi:hypothetical protein
MTPACLSTFHAQPATSPRDTGTHPLSDAKHLIPLDNRRFSTGGRPLFNYRFLFPLSLPGKYIQINSISPRTGDLATAQFTLHSF